MCATVRYQFSLGSRRSLLNLTHQRHHHASHCRRIFDNQHVLHLDLDFSAPLQREWLRVALSGIGDSVITVDTGGNVTCLNLLAESLTGWTPTDASGKPRR